MARRPRAEDPRSENEILVQAFQLLRDVIPSAGGALHRAIHFINKHPQPSILIQALQQLKSTRLLTQDNFDRIRAISRDIPRESTFVCFAIDALFQEDILNPKTLDAIVSHPDSASGLSHAIALLKRNNIFTDNELEILSRSDEPQGVAESFFALHSFQMLSSENREAVINMDQPCRIAQFPFSKVPQQLRQVIFDILISSDRQEDFCAESAGHVLITMFHQDILNPENLKKMEEHPLGIHRILKVLMINFLGGSERVLYRQNNFDALLDAAHAFLLSECALRNVWFSLPSVMVTQEVLNRLIQLSIGENPAEQIQNYANQLLRNGEQNLGCNSAQSTHTASVHRSVSQSASQLLAHYGKSLNDRRVEKIIPLLIAFVDEKQQQADEEAKEVIDLKDQYGAAQRCIKRITSPAYVYCDSTSKVTLYRLLALIYCALHDNQKRLSTIQDARKQFIQGLYEIQRGYNLTEAGLDTGGNDHPICIAGTFNKLVECMSGIHPACQIEFVTKETASLKLPCVVREVAKRHLERLQKIQSEEEDDQFWETIRDEVAAKMREEFRDLFDSDKTYLEFIENGKWTDLSKIFQEDAKQKNASGLFHQLGAASRDPRGQCGGHIDEAKESDSDDDVFDQGKTNR